MSLDIGCITIFLDDWGTYTSLSLENQKEESDNSNMIQSGVSEATSTQKAQWTMIHRPGHLLKFQHLAISLRPPNQSAKLRHIWLGRGERTSHSGNANPPPSPNVHTTMQGAFPRTASTEGKETCQQSSSHPDIP